MSNKNSIETLREHLFDALKGLKDETMDINTAKAISDIGQTIINSAKVEIDFQKQTGAMTTNHFFSEIESSASAGVKETTHGVLAINGNSRVHKMR